MKNLVVFASLAGLVGAGASAMAGTYEAWGHTFTYDSFQPRTVDVTVGTEKATGHKMNLVRLKNGHMMALVPADRYMALMTGSDADDMLH